MAELSSNFGNMFSMAGATLILPFLPMLPVQILLNNLLYAVSEMPIPLDAVDNEITAKPEHWDMRFIRNFSTARSRQPPPTRDERGIENDRSEDRGVGRGDHGANS
jgi:hypothetical protein